MFKKFLPLTSPTQGSLQIPASITRTINEIPETIQTRYREDSWRKRECVGGFQVNAKVAVLKSW